MTTALDWPAYTVRESNGFLPRIGMNVNWIGTDHEFVFYVINDQVPMAREVFRLDDSEMGFFIRKALEAML